VVPGLGVVQVASCGGLSVAARQDPDLVLIARTDAAAVEGIDAAIDRALRPAGRPRSAPLAGNAAHPA
jgi:hypothetical protein